MLEKIQRKNFQLAPNISGSCGTFSLPGKITNVEFFFVPRNFWHSGKILMLKTFGHFGIFYLFRADCKKLKRKSFCPPFQMLSHMKEQH
jgi:hypothetical protein